MKDYDSLFTTRFLDKFTKTTKNEILTCSRGRGFQIDFGKIVLQSYSHRPRPVLIFHDVFWTIYFKFSSCRTKVGALFLLDKDRRIHFSPVRSKIKAPTLVLLQNNLSEREEKQVVGDVNKSVELLQYQSKGF